jgi:two-component system LytT family response regulator
MAEAARRLRALVVDDEPLGRERVTSLLARDPAVEVVGACEDGVEAVDAIRTLAPDVVFLDVQMPEMDGFGVVEAVGAERMPPVVFVTAFDHYAVPAFDVNAVDYLLKPVDPERLAGAVQRVRARIDAPPAELGRRLEGVLAELRRSQAPAPGPFIVRTGRRWLPVRPADVDWISAADNYVELHAGGRAHLLRESMSAMESRLDPRTFLRIHRSTIVNLERVRAIEPWGKREYLFILHDGTQLQSGRGFADRVAAFLRGGS